MAEQRTAAIQRFLKDLDDLQVRINGDCMEPVLADGALVHLCRRRVYLPGDIVTFRNGSGQLVAHRMLGYLFNGREWLVVTRADHAKAADGMIRPEDIFGKVCRAADRKITIPVSARIRSVGRWVVAAGAIIRKKTVDL